MLKDVGALLLGIAVVALVLYLSFLFSKYLSKKSMQINGANYMRVIDRMAVGQDRSILIVEIQQKYYLVSNTAQNITILKELEGFSEPVVSDTAPKNFSESFQTVLKNMIQKKK